MTTTTETIPCPRGCTPEMWARLVASQPPAELPLIAAVFEEEADNQPKPPTEYVPACPSWCTTEHTGFQGWYINLHTGQHTRGHAGPDFGNFFTFSDEIPDDTERSGKIGIGTGASEDLQLMSIETARQVVADLTAAIAWATAQ